MTKKAEVVMVIAARKLAAGASTDPKREKASVSHVLPESYA